MARFREGNWYSNDLICLIVALFPSAVTWSLRTGAFGGGRAVRCAPVRAHGLLLNALRNTPGFFAKSNYVTLPPILFLFDFAQITLSSSNIICIRFSEILTIAVCTESLADTPDCWAAQKSTEWIQMQLYARRTLSVKGGYVYPVRSVRKENRPFSELAHVIQNHSAPQKQWRLFEIWLRRICCTRPRSALLQCLMNIRAGRTSLRPYVQQGSLQWPSEKSTAVLEWVGEGGVSSTSTAQSKWPFATPGMRVHICPASGFVPAIVTCGNKDSLKSRSRSPSGRCKYSALPSCVTFWGSKQVSNWCRILRRKFMVVSSLSCIREAAIKSFRTTVYIW